MRVGGDGMRVGVILAASLALSSCGAAFTQEVGGDYETGSFGNATMNNTLVMTGQGDFAVSLTRKFAAEAPNTVNFAFNSAVLDGAAQNALAQQAAWIRRYPDVKFRVYGHTDLVGSDGYNKALGLRRAKAAVNYLISRGISRSRLEAVVSYGKTQPLVYDPGPNVQNRRTVTEVSGLMGRKGQLQNGKYAQAVFDEFLVEGPKQVPGLDTSVVGNASGGQ